MCLEVAFYSLAAQHRSSNTAQGLQYDLAKLSNSPAVQKWVHTGICEEYS